MISIGFFFYILYAQEQNETFKLCSTEVAGFKLTLKFPRKRYFCIYISPVLFYILSICLLEILHINKTHENMYSYIYFEIIVF